ncbi:MAG: hypothetical protein ABMA01_09595 [Chthoniobacteraceae bacterium]
MSTTAREIIERIKSLPAEDQRTVCEEVARLSQNRREWEAQQEKLRAMQARHAGGGLLNRLLDERTKERARG